MPITQDRMLALISAVQDFQQAWKRAQFQFNVISGRFEAQEISLEQAWNETANLMNSSLQLEAPIQSNVTIATEVKHFQQARARNVRTAKWQRKRRGKPEQPIPREPSIYKLPPRPEPQPASSPIRTVIDPDAELDGAELDLTQPDMIYAPAETEEDFLSRLSPEDRARIEAEVRVRTTNEQAGADDS